MWDYVGFIFDYVGIVLGVALVVVGFWGFGGLGVWGEIPIGDYTMQCVVLWISRKNKASGRLVLSRTFIVATACRLVQILGVYSFPLAIMQ